MHIYKYNNNCNNILFARYKNRKWQESPEGANSRNEIIRANVPGSKQSRGVAHMCGIWITNIRDKGRVITYEIVFRCRIDVINNKESD